MARLLTDACKAEANSRLVVLRLATLILRMRAGWAELFGDFDTAAIAMAVASIHADRLLRDENVSPEVRSLEKPLPEHMYGRCNIASVAVAAGLNRETARRKISKLVDAGILEREGSDVRLSANLAQRSDLIKLVRTQVDHVRKTTDELMRDGVIVYEGDTN
ncbi:hypothetical protein [Sphingomonas sp. LHG3443-2]|uniref:hypothetical protein n=1 Tax=Sphingomonas sp. LHG3443-2 TaxID=2804639 RepID=UPI003CF764D5